MSLRLPETAGLELRVTQLESLLRLLHPDVFGLPEQPDPGASRAERKRSWQLIAGDRRGGDR